MKRFSKRLSGIAAAMAVFIALFMLHSPVVMAESWSFVDGGGSDGINVDTTKNAANPMLVDFNGTLFAAWSESIGPTNQIRVKKYDNGSWVTADNNTPLNKDAAKDATTPSLIVYNNELYATWQELNSTSMWQLRVAKFDGTSWSRIDGDGTSGLNANASTNARNPKLVVYNSNMYVIWDETGGNGISQIRVKKYVSVSTWNAADGGNSLNQNASYAGQYPSAAVYGSKLYVAWQENDSGSISQLRVKAFDGTTWSFVDGGGASGLNIDTTKRANTPFLAVYNGGLYVAWTESSSHNQLRVKKYDDTTWTLVDGGQSTGLNQNTNYDAYRARLAVFDGDLYASWYEGSSNNHVRVKKYDGTTWSFVDGNTAQGLNKSSSDNATFSYLSEVNDSLYTIFLENNGANQVRVVQMGPSNAAPTAASVSFTGTLKVGSTLTGTYTYGDTESDPEGTTTFKWYTAADAAGTGKAVITGATSNTLTLTSAQVGKYIIFEVTPAATTGTLSGTPATYTSASAVLANAAPTATGVSITGTLKQGNTLTGTYTYVDTENDPEGATTFQWYTAADANGTGKTALSGATSATLTLTSAEAGSYIVFEVTPKATSGTAAGAASSFTSSTAVLANSAPVASNVTISGSFNLNQTLTGTYTYADDDSDAEAGTVFKWYIADDAQGTNKTEIAGATTTTLTLKAAQYDKYIIFEVTPTAASGTTAGLPASSPAVGKVGVFKGDVNGDGQITPADALIANKYIQGKVTLTDEQKKALDMDNDGDVDADDSSLILSIYLGKGV